MMENRFLPDLSFDMIDVCQLKHLVGFTFSNLDF